MIEHFIGLFIKDHDQIKNPKVREQHGIFAGVVGLICNLLLTTFKIITGLVTGTMSIVGDSINNLSDAVSSVITLVGFKLAGMKADKNHPYGHGRFEYLAGLSVSVAVIAVAIELLRTSIQTILHPSRMKVDMGTIMILVVAILIKLWMSFFYYRIADKIDSAAMRAAASDSRSDCITTGVALIAVIVKIVWNVNIDGYAGAIVALFVIKAGFEAMYDTVVPLLGAAPSDEVIQRIKSMAGQYEEIQGVHDIRIHDYGPARTIASMHVEIPAEVGMIKAHEIVDSLEREIEEEQLVGEITIHVDPVITDDPQLLEMKQWTKQLLYRMDPLIHMHDFRLIHKKDSLMVLFEVEVPYGYSRSDETLKEDILKEYHAAYPDYKIKIVAVDKV